MVRLGAADVPLGLAAARVLAAGDRPATGGHPGRAGGAHAAGRPPR
jgi:hypothetical protein